MPHKGVCGMSGEREEREGVTWLKMVPGLCISFLMCHLLTLVVGVVLYLELFIFHILETIKGGLHLALMVKVCAFLLSFSKRYYYLLFRNYYRK